MFILVAACSNSSINPEPRAPDPFPIELSSRLSVYEVNVEEPSAALKLLTTVNRNYENYDKVKINYTVTNNHTQQELINKKLLDNKIDLYVKKSITDEINFREFSRYLIKIEASYSSYGQSESYFVDFDENGVSIVPQF